VYEERPELETKFFHLIENVVNDRSKIRDLEDKCLDLLHSSEGNILDDEELISTIEDSKNTANTIQRKVEQSEGTRISPSMLLSQDTSLVSYLLP
jgi:dynein heavy chain